jgi:hypothetical protein
VAAVLIRFKLCDHMGRILPGFSVEMPQPDETVEACLRRIRLEFGGRLMELHVDEIGAKPTQFVETA